MQTIECPRFDEEKWGYVVGYEGVYEVSSFGNVRRVGKNKLMCLHLRKGYPALVLSFNNIKKTFFVHRLVALTFCDKKEGKDFVNHINGIKTDNRVVNLEWVTSAENELHSRKILGKLSKNINGNHFVQALTKEQVLEARVLKGVFSARLVAAVNKVSESTILALWRGETYKEHNHEFLPTIGSDRLQVYKNANLKLCKSSHSIPCENPAFLDGELWLPVAGFERRYKISNYGRVWGLKRNRILTEAIVLGYKVVYLYDGKRLRNKGVHRLLMSAFYPVENWENLVVNHKDGNKLNNSFDNLEWCSHQENNIHALTFLNRMERTPRGEDHCQSILTERDVKEIRSLAKSHTHQVIADKFGLSRPHVTQIINRVVWKHLE